MQTPEERIQELEAALARERQAVTDAEQARQEFVSLVTHELRVPMTSIKGYTDLLLKGIMGPVSDAQAQFLNTIRANVERMSKMVADLADINKIEGGQLELKIAAVPLDDDLIDEALKPYQKEIKEKAQTVIRDIPADLPPLAADRGRLIQVLGNVLSNATKYSPERAGIIIKAAETPEGEIRVSVEDTGYGILADEQARIFEKFFRASDEETRATPGNGLSLYLSRQLLALHGGSIGFESERGKGSTFSFTVPKLAAETA